MPAALTQKISKEELAKQNSQFLAWSPEELAGKWREWVEVFADTTPEDEYILRYGWFRFFTIATWDDLNSRTPDFFVDFIASRQIPEALLCGYQVMDKLLFYLYFQANDVATVRDVYGKIRDEFIRSEAILGKDGEKNYTLSQATQEYLLIKSRGRDAVEVASFMDKLRKTMFPADGLTETYFTDDQNGVFGQMTELMDVFLEVKPEDIYTLVRLHVHPEINESELSDIAGMNDLPPKPAPRIGPRYIELPETVVPEKLVPEMPAEKKENLPAQPKEEKGVIVTVVPTHAEIRAKIDAAFEADKDGQYADLDHVLSALEKAAEKYHEPKIAELYYFDEASGKFKWSV